MHTAENNEMKKASGPDDLITEHLHYGGSTPNGQSQYKMQHY